MHILALLVATEAEEHSFLHFDGRLFFYRRAPGIALCLVFCHYFDTVVQLLVVIDSVEKYFLHFDGHILSWYRAAGITHRLVFSLWSEAAAWLSVANYSAKEYFLHFDVIDFGWYRLSGIAFSCFSSPNLCLNIPRTCHSMEMSPYLPTNEARMPLMSSRTVQTLRDIDVPVSPGPLLLLNSGTN